MIVAFILIISQVEIHRSSNVLSCFITSYYIVVRHTMFYNMPYGSACYCDDTTCKCTDGICMLLKRSTGRHRTFLCDTLRKSKPDRTMQSAFSYVVPWGNKHSLMSVLKSSFICNTSRWTYQSDERALLPSLVPSHQLVDRTFAHQAQDVRRGSRARFPWTTM